MGSVLLLFCAVRRSNAAIVRLIIVVEVIIIVPIISHSVNPLVHLAVTLTDFIGEIGDTAHNADTHDTLDVLLYIQFDYLHLLHYAITVVDLIVLFDLIEHDGKNRNTGTCYEPVIDSRQADFHRVRHSKTSLT